MKTSISFLALVSINLVSFCVETVLVAISSRYQSRIWFACVSSIQFFNATTRNQTLSMCVLMVFRGRKLILQKKMKSLFALGIININISTTQKYRRRADIFIYVTRGLPYNTKHPCHDKARYVIGIYSYPINTPADTRVMMSLKGIHCLHQNSPWFIDVWTIRMSCQVVLRNAVSSRSP